MAPNDYMTSGHRWCWWTRVTLKATRLDETKYLSQPKAARRLRERPDSERRKKEEQGQEQEQGQTERENFPFEFIRSFESTRSQDRL